MTAGLVLLALALGTAQAARSDEAPELQQRATPMVLHDGFRVPAGEYEVEVDDHNGHVRLYLWKGGELQDWPVSKGTLGVTAADGHRQVFLLSAGKDADGTVCLAPPEMIPTGLGWAAVLSAGTGELSRVKIRAPGIAPPARVEAEDVIRQVRSVLDAYRAAVEAMSLDHLAGLVDEHLLVLEGAEKNVGWADYRDNHIGKHFQEFESFRYERANLLSTEVSRDLAWAAQEVEIAVGKRGGAMRLAGMESFAFRKLGGEWKIIAIHLSLGRKAPAVPAPTRGNPQSKNSG